MKVHDFKESLAKSHAQADAPWWEDVYRAAFPTLLACHDMRNADWAQRAGVDRQIVLASSKVILVDEKVREANWPDVLLEYWSANRKTPGWIAKDLACDYIAYAWVPSQTCLLMPFPMLRLAWKRHRQDWVARYPRIEANNGNYLTVSVAVPTEVLKDAIRDAMVVRWGEKAEAA